MVRKILAAALVLLATTLPSLAMDMSGAFDMGAPEIKLTWEYPEAPAVRAEMQTLVDCFGALLEKDFLPRDANAGVEIVMTRDEDDFNSYLREHHPEVYTEMRRRSSGKDETSHGIYLSEGKLLAYERAGFGTVTSLLLPGLIQREYDDLPQWAMAGLRAYFERIYGYWERDRATGERVIRFAHGYHNPVRLETLKLALPNIAIADLVSAVPVQEDAVYQSRQRLLMMFIWKEGKLPAFVQALKTRDRKMYPTYLEAVFGQSLEQLQPRFHAFQVSIQANWSQVMKTPPSQLYADRSTFEAMTASIWR